MKPYHFPVVFPSFSSVFQVIFFLFLWFFPLFPLCLSFPLRYESNLFLILQFSSSPFRFFPTLIVIFDFLPFCSSLTRHPYYCTSIIDLLSPSFKPIFILRRLRFDAAFETILILSPISFVDRFSFMRITSEMISFLSIFPLMALLFRRRRADVPLSLWVRFCCNFVSTQRPLKWQMLHVLEQKSSKGPVEHDRGHRSTSKVYVADDESYDGHSLMHFSHPH